MDSGRDPVGRLAADVRAPGRPRGRPAYGSWWPVCLVSSLGIPSAVAKTSVGKERVWVLEEGAPPSGGEGLAFP